MTSIPFGFKSYVQRVFRRHRKRSGRCRHLLAMERQGALASQLLNGET
jgi:hypothetical protein